ncbi:hypothetical protein [Bacillus wiedmannii]|uniref:hypothetical protein n=1 Tax=Bacillus wiedmannii TaxID=1890302 RepID=UPI001245E536|nr:hypothetical protein [Bacillus wiedmannii]
MTKDKKPTLKQNVEAILREYEVARGDDKILQLLYWRKIDKIDFDNFPSDYMEKATPSESITRARRVIQEEGRFLPADDIVEMRKSREMSMRKSIATKREVI